MEYNEIRAAEHTDPIRYVANESSEAGAAIPEVGELLAAGGSLVEQDVIAKADAGAQLFYAIYHHPRAVELMKEFDTMGFASAYGHALKAYGVVKY